MLKGHVEVGFEASHANGPEGHRCANPHGHSWKAEIEWVFAEEDRDEYGWGPDFGAVKSIVRVLDHTNLNEMLSFPPSAENLAIYVHTTLLKTFPQIGRVTVRIYEGGGNWVEYK